MKINKEMKRAALDLLYIFIAAVASIFLIKSYLEFDVIWRREENNAAKFTYLIAFIPILYAVIYSLREGIKDNKEGLSIVFLIAFFAYIFVGNWIMGVMFDG